MNATRPLCVSAVMPINAINKMIIGNMWNFLLWINNAKTSLIVENLVMNITILVEAFMFVHFSNLTI
jgi:hypothetical protein